MLRLHQRCYRGLMADNSTEKDSIHDAIEAGETLLSVLRKHIDVVAAGADEDEAAVELDRQLWEAVASYGDALDELYDDDEDDDEGDDSDELTITVRARYDYTVVDEKDLLSAGQGVGAAIAGLIEKAGGRPLAALEVDALETGSGVVTVHLNDDLLLSSDFAEAEEVEDLLLIAPGETLAAVVEEPVFESRAEAEAAAKLSD